jgi:O-antigen ligase/polysaccharide polymerase Wzy-like membrane protein
MSHTEPMPVATPRRAVVGAAVPVLLAGPTALAFSSGGYFTTARVWAGLAAWILVAVAILAGGPALPRSTAGRVAIAALTLLGLWTLLSVTWAPIAGTAYGAGQIVLLYVGGLMAAAALLRLPAAQRAVEPGLGAGALIVIGYALAGRLAPGLLHFARSVSAQGRLEQPLTYWNAMGELAALGFVLCARLAGDADRPRALRAGAAAAAAPLGLGVYLSFSRGALFACVAGLVALVVLAPARAALRGVGVALGAGVLASLAAAPSHGVTSLAGSLGTREREGAITLGLLAVVMAMAAAAQLALVRRDTGAVLRLPRRAPWLALGIVCVGFALAVVLGSKESSTQPLSGGATRLETLQSNRYAYWRVALDAFTSEPIRGVGAGGWAVWWLRDRTVNEGAQDAHSLPLQTLAELGVVGLALLLAFLAAVAVAARRAMARAPALAAGPAAALVVYVAHAPLDWDWQLPAVTLVAVAAAGLLLALADPA